MISKPQKNIWVWEHCSVNLKKNIWKSHILISGYILIIISLQCIPWKQFWIPFTHIHHDFHSSVYQELKPHLDIARWCNKTYSGLISKYRLALETREAWEECSNYWGHRSRSTACQITVGFKQGAEPQGHYEWSKRHQVCSPTAGRWELIC